MSELCVSCVSCCALCSSFIFYVAKSTDQNCLLKEALRKRKGKEILEQLVPVLGFRCPYHLRPMEHFSRRLLTHFYTDSDNFKLILERLGR